MPESAEVRPGRHPGDLWLFRPRPITQINGYPEPKAAGWNVEVDGGAAVQAKRNTPIHLGDTIYLRYE